MYNESTDSRSGRAAPNKTRMPTQRAGKATEVTSAGGRATEWEAMQSKQFCRDGPEVEWK